MKNTNESSINYKLVQVKLWLPPTVPGEPVDVMVHFSDADELDQELHDLDLHREILIPDVEQ